MKPIELYEKKLNNTFRDRQLLVTAVTHSSYANEQKGKCDSYERLEFLGDSILGFVTARYLFENFPELSEGELTKTRAALVCERSLCGFSKKLGVGEFLRLSHGKQHSGGRARARILAGVVESTLAALSLHRGRL